MDNVVAFECRVFESSHRRSTCSLGGPLLSAASFLKTDVRYCFINKKEVKEKRKDVTPLENRDC